jgi:hypothetical protein
MLKGRDAASLKLTWLILLLALIRFCLTLFCVQVDPIIPRNFGVSTILEGKAECKTVLQDRCQLQRTQEKAIVGVVTRLTTQKGIHLIKHAIHSALERGCQVRAMSVFPYQPPPAVTSRTRGAL